jgi:ATP-dependent DNA helicase RecG
MRSELCAAHTNVLEATATAIPRTLALVSHAGMDVSILAECPVKKDIETHILTRQDRQRLFKYLKLVVQKGHQIAIVYPLVSEKSEQDRSHRRNQAAEKKIRNGEADLFDGLQVETRESIERVTDMLERQFPNNVGILHGRMSPEEKQSVIDRMKRKEINVIGASTAIELGVTMPSLKCIILINPNTLGLASLHQLRGRIARHGGHGMCFIYLPNEVSEHTMARYQVFASESSGFALSLLDMDMRGIGDISEEGEDQSGATKTLFKGLKIQPQDIAQLLQ